MKRARLAAGWLKQKYKLLALVAVLLTGSICMLITTVPHAYAASTATWKDSKTIEYNGVTYTDKGTLALAYDASQGKAYHVFASDTQSNGCISEIYFDTSTDIATAKTANFMAGQIGQGPSGSTGQCIGATGGTVSFDKTQSDATGSDGSTAGQVATEDPCDASGDPLSWVVCPVINMINGAIQYMQGIIDQLLKFDVTTVFDRSQASGKAYYSAWNSFRLVAIAIVVIAGLVMVITQALGLEVFDAYTVKKVVPRLFIAAIGISLSWYLLEFLASFTNDVGLAVRNMIYWPFRNIGNGDVGLNNPLAFLLGDAVIGGTIVALGIGGVLSLIATAGLAILIAFLVLIVRQMVLILLVLLAPIAIALYVLPNTQKVYHLWWDSLMKGFMMFPIITAFIATGRVFSVVAANAGGNAVHNTINQIISLIAFFLPYFALPFTFRLAGGALATIGGLVNDRSRGTFDRLKKYRANKTAENYQALRAGNRYKGNNAVSRSFNRTTRGVGAMGEAGINPLKWKSRVSGAVSRNSLDEAREAMEKNQYFGAIKANDDYLSAALLSKGSDSKAAEILRSRVDASGKRIYNDRTVNEAVGQMRMARRSMTNDGFETAAAMALPGTGTAFNGGAGEMHDMINSVAGNDRNRAATLLAAMRSGAEGARRFDLAGGSYGSQLNVLEAQHSGSLTSNAASTRITEEALEARGGGYVAGARNGAVKNFAPVMYDNLKVATGTGDVTRTAHELAKVAGRYDAMASVSPENADLLGHEVLAKELTYMKPVMVNGSISHYEQATGTVRQAIEDWRPTGTFQELRREYGSAATANAAAAAAAGTPESPTAGPPVTPS